MPRVIGCWRDTRAGAGAIWAPGLVHAAGTGVCKQARTEEGDRNQDDYVTFLCPLLLYMVEHVSASVKSSQIPMSHLDSKRHVSLQFMNLL